MRRLPGPALRTPPMEERGRGTVPLATAVMMSSPWRRGPRGWWKRAPAPPPFFCPPLQRARTPGWVCPARGRGLGVWGGGRPPPAVSFLSVPGNRGPGRLGCATHGVPGLDVVGAVTAQNVPGLVVTSVGSHRHQRPTRAGLLLVPLRLVFRYAHADQGSGDRSHRGAHGQAGERRGEGSRGDDRADDGDGQGASACQEASEAAD